MGKVSEELKSGLTLKTLILGVILAAIIATINCTGEDTTHYGAYADIAWAPTTGAAIYWGWGSDWLLSFGTFGFIFLAITAIALVNALRPKTFTLQEVIILLIMMWIGGYSMGGTWLSASILKGYGPLNWVVGPYLWVSEADRPGVMALLPSWWPQPTAEEALRMTQAGQWVNWGLWSGPLGWALLYTFSQAFLLLSVALLLRRQYVDVEMLSFPVSEIAVTTTDLTQPNGKAKFFKDKLFWLGFLIQFLWIATMRWGNMAVAGTANYSSGTYFFGVVSMPTKLTWIWPVWHFTSLRLLPWMPLTWIGLAPFMIGWGYMLSIDVMVGYIIGGLIFHLIWPVVFSGLGMLPVFPIMSGGADIASTLRAPGAVAMGGNFLIAVEAGVYLGLAIVPLWINRRLFKGILGAITGKEPEDPGKPMSYRLTWVMLIVSFILTIASGALIGVNIGGWIFYVIVATIFLMGFIRVYSETGGWWLMPGGYWAFMNPGWLKNIIGTTALVLSGVTGVTATSVMSKVFFQSDFPVGTKTFWAAAIIGALAPTAFMMGKRSNTKSKDVLKGFVIAMALAYIVTVLATTMFAYALDWDKALLPKYWHAYAIFGLTGARDAASLAPYTWGNLGTPTLNYPGQSAAWLGVGFVIVAALTFMRARMPWFPLNTAGLALGMTFSQVAFYEIIVALILKYLTIRLGGIALYNKLKPLAVGTILGYGLGIFVPGFFSFWNVNIAQMPFV